MIFDQNWDFWPQLLILTKIAIFDQNCDFWPKLWFLTEIMIFNQNLVLGKIFNFWQFTFHFLTSSHEPSICNVLGMQWRSATMGAAGTPWLVQTGADETHLSRCVRFIFRACQFWVWHLIRSFYLKFDNEIYFEIFRKYIFDQILEFFL